MRENCFHSFFLKAIYFEELLYPNSEAHIHFENIETCHIECEI